MKTDSVFQVYLYTSGLVGFGLQILLLLSKFALLLNRVPVTSD